MQKFTDAFEAAQSAGQSQNPGAAHQVHAGTPSANFTQAQVEAARRSGYDAGFSAGFAAARESKGSSSNNVDESTAQRIANLINQQRAA
mgnify:CR=1 FL=1